MDLLFVCGLFLSLVTIYLFHVLITFSTKNRGAQLTSLLPPGNVGFPLVGESIEFFSHLKAGKSENFIFDRMTRYSRQVFKTSLIAEPVAVMCGSDGSKFLFTNDNKLVKHWWPPALGVATLLAPSRQSPFPFKDIILMFFRVDDLKKQVGIMDKLAHTHFATDWQGRPEVMVFPLAKKYAFTVGCYLALSIEDAEIIQKIQTQAITILGGFLKLKINLPGTAYNRAQKAWNATRKLLCEIVRQRRTEFDMSSYKQRVGFRDTLMSLLAAISESGQKMSDMEIADRLIGVIIAIQDTTSLTISMIFKYLAMHPDLYDAVLRENMEVAANKTPGEVLNWDDIQKMKYSWNVAREVMRLCPPVQGSFREAITDFTHAGYHIPKGWKVFLSVKAIHMDPKYFPEPEKLDPSRFEGEGPLPNTYMPFGGGASLCPGRNFAQGLVLVFIHNAVRRYKWESLTVGSNEQMVVDPVPWPISGIPVRLYPHQNRT